MAQSIKKVTTYVTDVVNRPGMLARILEALAAAGANLEFVIARRVSANTARVYLAPLTGKKQLAVAADVGLQPAKGMHALRIQSPDRPGLGARLTRAMAARGLNLRGLSAASIGKQNLCYLAFATEAEAAQAAKIVKQTLSKR